MDQTESTVSASGMIQYQGALCLREPEIALPAAAELLTDTCHDIRGRIHGRTRDADVFQAERMAHLMSLRILALIVEPSPVNENIWSVRVPLAVRRVILESSSLRVAVVDVEIDRSSIADARVVAPVE